MWARLALAPTVAICMSNRTRAKLGLVRKVLATKWSESQTQEALDAIDDQAQAECMDKDTKQFVPKALRTPRA